MKQRKLRERILIAIALILFASPALAGQEDTEDPSLFEKTLYSDISTASYYELLSWCRELDLETKGNAEVLRNELYSHYGVVPDETAREAETGGTIVKIVTADRSEYYTIEEIGEDYVRISGRVKLIVKQPSKNITHAIEADSILFNETTSSMTASGSITYTKEENGKIEEYSGDNFTFNVHSWKGVILKGDFRRTQEVNEKEMEFIFSGEAIRKGEGDVVVLDEGSITSCDTEDTHYQIKARKIWILGPDEWAILSGFLYVGHVPVLYIPFYHLPGNDLFFNPVIGDDRRRGMFIQTTTYLLGRKQADKEDDSFFINIADSDETYKLVPQGLYLFKEKGEPDNRGADYIKYKLDYYSRLGGYTALEGSLARLWEMRNVSFDLGIGVTKTIRNYGDQYTNYFAEEGYAASWNSSDFFGLTLPFRWGLSFGFTLFNFETKFEYITDPYFINDFANRAENFDWLNYLLAQTTEQEDIEETSRTSLNWSVKGNLNIPNDWAGQYIKSFSFSPLKLNLYWETKPNGDYPNYSDSPLVRSADPGRDFFYPENITWPQTSLNLSGVLLEYKSGEEQIVPKDELEVRKSIRSPWESGIAEEEDNQEGEGKSLRSPEKQGDIPVRDEPDEFYTKIDYDVTGYFNFISYTDSSAWNAPGDIDFDIRKSLLTNNNTVNLNYNLNGLGSLLVLKGKNSFSSNYLLYSGDYSSDESTRQLDGRKLKWQNTFEFSLKPLKNVPYMADSSVKYNFDTDLFSYEYSSSAYRENWIEWDSDHITNHKTAVNFLFAIPFLKAALSFDTTLPPLDIKQAIIPSLELTFYKWTSKVSSKATYNESKWIFDPLVVSTSFDPLDKLSLSGSFKYDIETDTAESLEARLRLWWFSATYVMADEIDYGWDIPTGQPTYEVDANNDPIKTFIPTALNMALDYSYKSPAFWKNRVTMETGVNTTLNMNLQQFHLTTLDFTFFYNLHIFEFLDLKLSLKSSNDYMFIYFPGIRDDYGIEEQRNFFADLFKSFNFFSPGQQDRYDSFFNMDSLNVTLVHKLHDWDLEMTYSGRPVLPGVSEAEQKSRWDSSFSFLIRWNPIEKLKVKTDYGDEIWNVDTEFQ